MRGIRRPLRGGAGARRASAGFSLVEVVVAVAILAIGIVGVVGLQATLFHSARFSADISTAAAILQHRAEELGSMSIAALDGPPGVCAGAALGCAVDGAFTAPPASGCSQQVLDPMPVSVPGPGGPYRIDTGVTPHPDAVNHPNARLATISVCWAEAGGRARQIQSLRVVGDR